MSRFINTVKTWLVSGVILLLPLQPVIAEIVVITRPLPDSKGELWPREYFDANFAMFVMPRCFMMHSGMNKVPVRPQITKYAPDPVGGAEVRRAWINIIDLEHKRYFSGSHHNWFSLDSTEVIRIRDGYDTCIVYMRYCDRFGMPYDSCRVAGSILNDSLGISDISYIVFTGFDHGRRAGPQVYAKSGYYYRKILNYIALEASLEQISGETHAKSPIATPIGCNCILNFGAKSISKVIYRGEAVTDLY